ncbi:MAG TPA: tRNA pseudouridine(55) synthase TruB [Candidatus Magasanikbacteria bacterium]|nr:tRNA pseudouridine(55) synthase TruB [Candidatus Magasanikbacteria bacterium]
MERRTEVLATSGPAGSASGVGAAVAAVVSRLALTRDVGLHAGRLDARAHDLVPGHPHDGGRDERYTTPGPTEFLHGLLLSRLLLARNPAIAYTKKHIMSTLHSGFLLINKPKNWTSHDVVAYVRNIARKATGERKIRVGHAGTLDPFATGLLIVGVGREATKRLDEFKSLSKTYIATLRCGATSNTYDSTGIIQQCNNETMKQLSTKLTLKKIHIVVQSFLGKQNQTPPMYSAKKINGKKLYELARKGIEIKRKSNEIEILDIKILEYSWPTLTIEVQCSSGTYIRTLAHDIGQKLDCGAYCEELERTSIGEYKIENTVDPKKITRENIESLIMKL